MHTEYDSAAFFSGMFMFFGAFGAAVYSVLVLIALVLFTFRSRRALYTSFWLSAIVSLPFLLGLMIMLPYISRILGDDPSKGLFLLINAVLLIFVFAGPTVQYQLVRRNIQRARE